MPDGGAALTSGRDGTVRVWDLVTASCQRVLEKHDDYIEGHVVTPDGRLCVSGGNDRTARVWDLATGACRHVLSGHTGFIESVGMTPDGRFVLTPSRDFTVKVWDLASGSCVRSLLGHRYGVTGAVVTPDGHLAVTAVDNTPRLAPADGACLAVYHAGARGRTGGRGGRILCGTSDGQVHFLTPHGYAGPPLLTAVRLRRHAVGDKASGAAGLAVVR
jgi:WD40 repeat protein